MQLKKTRSAFILFWMIAFLLAGLLPVSHIAYAQKEEESPETETETEPVPMPEAPVPEWPQGECSSRAIGFYWEPSADADYYEVNWQNDRGEQGTLQRKSEDWTCGMGRCILYTGLPVNGSYTWTVTAVNDSGSAESEEMAFSVGAGLTAPEAYRPNRTQSNQNRVVFEWEDTGEGAVSFRVQAADRATGRILVDRWYPVQGMFIGNGICSQTTDVYLPSGSYHWRVKSSTGQAESAWSGWTDFEVECAECMSGTYANTVTALLFPGGITIDLAPHFEWRAVMGASYYMLKVTDASGAELVNVSVPSSNCDLETCSYKPDLFLSAGSRYSWSVGTYGPNNGLWGFAEASFDTAVPEIMNEISFIGPNDDTALDPENPEIIWSDPGEKTASFSLAIIDGAGETLFVGDISRSEAWCDGMTCSIQFRTIPEGDDFRIILTPYSEYNITGNTISLQFDNGKK